MDVTQLKKDFTVVEEERGRNRERKKKREREGHTEREINEGRKKERGK